MVWRGREGGEKAQGRGEIYSYGRSTPDTVYVVYVLCLLSLCVPFSERLKPREIISGL